MVRYVNRKAVVQYIIIQKVYFFKCIECGSCIILEIVVVYFTRGIAADRVYKDREILLMEIML